MAKDHPDRVVFCGLVYAAVHKNGGVYIGQTSQTFERRVRQHISKARQGVVTPFYNAVRKHGGGSFEWIILFDNLVSKEECDELEKMSISLFRKYTTVYNATEGGEGGSPTKETRLKISKSKVGKARSEDSRKKQSETMRGRKYSDSRRKNLSLAKIGNKYALGHKRSAETRKRMSAAQKGNKKGLGRVVSEETRRKLSEATKKSWGIGGARGRS